MAKKTVTFYTKNKAELIREFNQFGKEIKNVLHSITDVTFNEMVNYAKENAVWIDRTGNARRSISAEDFSQGDVLEFYLTIGVDYGIWLEVANDGKYKILRPTATVFEPQLVKRFEAVGIKLTGNISFTMTEGF